MAPDRDFGFAVLFSIGKKPSGIGGPNFVSSHLVTPKHPVKFFAELFLFF
jgi:hypothetical protein